MSAQSATPDTIVEDTSSTTGAPSTTGRLVAEFAGTLLLVLAGLGTGLFATEVIDAALGFGLGLMAAIVAFGYLSGGHFNPAVTLAALIAGRIRAKDALLYVVAQVLGAVVAAGLLVLILVTLISFDQTQQLIGSVSNTYNNATSNASMGDVLLVEVVLTALFTAVVLGATSARANTALAPLAIGVTLALFLTIAAPFDGGSLNPARSTGPALFAGTEVLLMLWAFWVGPLLGALVTGLAFRLADSAAAAREAKIRGLKVGRTGAPGDNAVAGIGVGAALAQDNTEAHESVEASDDEEEPTDETEENDSSDSDSATDSSSEGSSSSDGGGSDSSSGGGDGGGSGGGGDGGGA